MPAYAQPPFDLSGRVALVTGANHGIGAATARRLAACGARVVLAYLRLTFPLAEAATALHGAVTGRAAGATVLTLERSPEPWRGPRS